MRPRIRYFSHHVCLRHLTSTFFIDPLSLPLPRISSNAARCWSLDEHSFLARTIFLPNVPSLRSFLSASSRLLQTSAFHPLLIGTGHPRREISTDIEISSRKGAFPGSPHPVSRFTSHVSLQHSRGSALPHLCHNSSNFAKIIPFRTSFQPIKFLKLHEAGLFLCRRRLSHCRHGVLTDGGAIRWHLRSFKRSHMGHAHHHQDHDPRKEAGEAGERVTRWGLWADIGLAFGKGFAGYVSGSTAVIADAAHSMSDVVLSGVALWFFKAARAPKDEGHPYGHGKFETLGALGVSTMLLITGGGIAWHAIELLQAFIQSTYGTDFGSAVQVAADQISSLGHEHGNSHRHSHGGHHHGIDMEHQALALIATIISIGIKEGLYWTTKRVGEAHGSELLKANAWHHRSDAISSVIALLGVGGTIFGLHFLDPVAGLLVSGMVIKAGLQSGYRSVQELVDSGVSDSVLSPIRETAIKVKGVEGCHYLRGRRAGSSMHLDVHIEVDPWLSVSAANIIGETVRHEIQMHHPIVAEVFIHIEPTGTHSDSIKHGDSSNRESNNKDGVEGNKINSFQQQEVEKAICHIIKSEFSKTIIFGRVTSHFLEGRVLVDLEVSMHPDLVVREAMELAVNAERRIIKALPEISAVNMQLRLKNEIQLSVELEVLFPQVKDPKPVERIMYAKHLPLILPRGTTLEKRRQIYSLSHATPPPPQKKIIIINK